MVTCTGHIGIHEGAVIETKRTIVRYHFVTLRDFRLT